MKKTLLTIAVIAITTLANAQTFTTITGTAGYGYSGDGGQAISAKISGVGGMAFDQSGNLFFSDEGNHVIRKITTSGIITTVAGTGISGNSGDGGPAIAAQLYKPQNLAFDAAGNLYIKEAKNGKIRKVDLMGNISTYATIPQDALRAAAMAIDASGNLYVNNDSNPTVYKINTSGVSTLYAGMPGTQGASGDGGPATAAVLWQAYYLATDPLGNLYISEYQANTIRKVNSLGIISTFAGIHNSTSTQGFGGMVGDGGPATSAYLLAPHGMAVNSIGDLYFTGDNGKIRFVNSGGIINSISSGSNIVAADLLVFDSSNNLYYTDMFTTQIKKITNIQAATGLEETNANKMQFSLFPNPATSKINIELLDTNNEPTKIIITNLLGEVVLNTIETSNKFSVNTNNLKSGVYFVNLSNDGKTATKKIVVN